MLLAAALAIVAVLGGSALAVFLLVRLPATYFVDPRPAFMANNHRLLRACGLVAKNLVGAALVLVGIGLSLPGVPGPGIVTLLVGLALLDFPGKRALERRIVSLPGVLAAVNALRRRFGRPPLVVERPEPRTTKLDAPR